MNILLWVLQILTALMYASSGVMKIFMFEKISHDVQSFGALPERGWMVLGVIELVCVVGLIVPGILHRYQTTTVIAAAILSLESLIFIRVHARYHEKPTMLVCTVLGLLVALIGHRRCTLPA